MSENRFDALKKSNKKVTKGASVKEVTKNKFRSYGVTKIPSEHYDFLSDLDGAINMHILRAIEQYVEYKSK